MKEFLQEMENNENGLTLVELLAVVVILAFVGAIAFVAIGNVIDNSRKDAVISNAAQVLSAAKLAEVSSRTEIPQGQFIYASSNPADSNSIDTVGTLVDPWNAENHNYLVRIVKNGDKYRVISSGTGKCDFHLYEEEILKMSRDDICKIGVPATEIP